MARRHRV